MNRMFKFALPAIAAIAVAPLAQAQTAVVPATPATPAETVVVPATPAAPAGTVVAPATPATPAGTVVATPQTLDMNNIVLADNLIDAEVRAVNVDDATWGTDYYVDPYTAEADMDDIGEVEDIALGSDGQMKGLIVDVGGFLGIGEHRVLLAPDQFRVFRQEGWGEDYKVVSRLTKEQLEALPEFTAGR